MVASEVLEPSLGGPQPLAGAAADAGPAAPVVPVLRRFERATLAMIERRELLNRYDRKILVAATDLPALIEPLLGKYVITFGGVSTFSPYSTLYFDTPTLRCFHDHRKGRRLRHKVRIRHYHDRRITFLEVKSRRSDLVSFKHRLPLAFGTETLGTAELAFVTAHTGIDAAELVPIVWIDYQRATLIGLDHTERLTLDVDVRAAPAADRSRVDTSVAALAFIEIKQAPIKMSTPVMRVVRDRGLRPASVSKYCTAIAALGMATTRARFRAVLRAGELP